MKDPFSLLPLSPMRVRLKARVLTKEESLDFDLTTTINLLRTDDDYSF